MLNITKLVDVEVAVSSIWIKGNISCKSNGTFSDKFEAGEKQES